MQRWFKSIGPFLVCFTLGAVILSLLIPKDDLQTQEIELSSMAPSTLYRYDYDTSAINSAVLYQKINQLNANWYRESQKSERVGYVYSPEELKAFENQMKAVTSIGDDVLLQYETANTCVRERMWLENDIANHPDLRDLVEEREESPLLPRKCVAYTMNSFNIKQERLAQCPTRDGLPVAGSFKPCTTKNLANLTYNTFVDVMDCVGFNPMNVLPKLANESGMTINALGGGFDAGVAQMTISGISTVNQQYAQYIDQMRMSTKPSCMRLMKHENLLVQASELKKDRCGFITPAENPLRSFVYSAVLNKINENDIRRQFKIHNIEARLVSLGFANVDIDSLIELMGYMSYNSGSGVAMKAIKSYIEKREANAIPTSTTDFNFLQEKSAYDIDGTLQDVHKIARLFVASPFKLPGDTPEESALKLRRVKILPEKIRNAYKLTFPEYLIYKQNNFNEIDEMINEDYRVLGAPGYIGFLAKKDKANRDVFQNLRLGADYCSNPNYLKVSKPSAPSSL